MAKSLQTFCGQVDVFVCGRTIDKHCVATTDFRWLCKWFLEAKHSRCCVSGCGRGGMCLCVCVCVGGWGVISFRLVRTILFVAVERCVLCWFREKSSPRLKDGASQSDHYAPGDPNSVASWEVSLKGTTPSPGIRRLQFWVNFSFSSNDKIKSSRAWARAPRKVRTTAQSTN
jgi:hypothetical protein